MITQERVKLIPMNLSKLTQQQQSQLITRQITIETWNNAYPEYDAYAQHISLSEWWFNNLWFYLRLFDVEIKIKDPIPEVLEVLA